MLGLGEPGNPGASKPADTCGKEGWMMRNLAPLMARIVGPMRSSNNGAGDAIPPRARVHAHSVQRRARTNTRGREAMRHAPYRTQWSAVGASLLRARSSADCCLPACAVAP